MKTSASGASSIKEQPGSNWLVHEARYERSVERGPLQSLRPRPGTLQPGVALITLPPSSSIGGIMVPLITSLVSKGPKAKAARGRPGRRPSLSFLFCLLTSMSLNSQHDEREINSFVAGN